MTLAHKPAPWKFRFVQGDSGEPIALLLESLAKDLPHNDPCILAVREDWIGHIDRHPEAYRVLEAAPALLDAARKSAGPCAFDPLNPCFDGRPEDVIGRHWGGGEACGPCHTRAAIRLAEEGR